MSLFSKIHFLIQLQEMKMNTYLLKFIKLKIRLNKNIYLKPLSSFLRASASWSVISLSRSRSLFLSCVGLREYLWLGRRSNWTVLRALFWVVWYSVLPLQNRFKNENISISNVKLNTVDYIKSTQFGTEDFADYCFVYTFLLLVQLLIKSILQKLKCRKGI